MDNYKNRCIIIPHRQRSQFRETKDRRKRPGTSNLNRQTNVVRSIESASLILKSTPITFSAQPELSQPTNKKEEEEVVDILEDQKRSHHHISIFKGLSESSEEDESSIDLAVPNRQNSFSRKTEERNQAEAVDVQAKIPTGTSELRTKIVVSKSKAVIDPKKSSSQNLSPVQENSQNVVGSLDFSRPHFQDSYNFEDEHVRLNNLTNISDFQEEEDGDIPLSRVRVSNSIYFSQAKNHQNAFFTASIKIENVSKHFVTFCIKTSNPGIFTINPMIDVIQPGMSRLVSVKTKSQFACHFSDLVQETFAILATPIYSSSHLDVGKLESLWKMYGTPFFPPIAAEDHVINFVYKIKSPTACSSYSMMDNVVENNFCSTIHGMWRKKTVFLLTNNNNNGDQNISGKNTKEFCHRWPIEEDQHNFMSTMNQIHGWKCYFQKEKKERQLKWKMTRLLGLFCFVVIIIYCIPSYHPPYFDWHPDTKQEGIEIISGQPEEPVQTQQEQESTLQFLDSFVKVIFSQVWMS